MESYKDRYIRWQQLQQQVEELEDICDQHERQWNEGFYSALDNLAQPEPFLRSLVKGRKGFDLFLACRRERDRLVNTEWSEAVDKLRESIEDRNHLDAL